MMTNFNDGEIYMLGALIVLVNLVIISPIVRALTKSVSVRKLSKGRKIRLGPVNKIRLVRII